MVTTRSTPALQKRHERARSCQDMDPGKNMPNIIRCESNKLIHELPLLQLLQNWLPRLQLLLATKVFPRELGNRTAGFAIAIRRDISDPLPLDGSIARPSPSSNRKVARHRHGVLAANERLAYYYFACVNCYDAGSLRIRGMAHAAASKACFFVPWLRHENGRSNRRSSRKMACGKSVTEVSTPEKVNCPRFGS